MLASGPVTPEISGELPAALTTFRPTILLAVPRVFDKLAAAAASKPRPMAPAAVRSRRVHSHHL